MLPGDQVKFPEAALALADIIVRLPKHVKYEVPKARSQFPKTNQLQITGKSAAARRLAVKEESGTRLAVGLMRFRLGRFKISQETLHCLQIGGERAHGQATVIPHQHRYRDPRDSTHLLHTELNHAEKFLGTARAPQLKQESDNNQNHHPRHQVLVHEVRGDEKRWADRGVDVPGLFKEENDLRQGVLHQTPNHSINTLTLVRQWRRNGHRTDGGRPSGVGH